MSEMRWIVRSNEKILQYRFMREVINYSSQNPRTGEFIREMQWSIWHDVPTSIEE
jgi:hypothetical protein